MKMMSKYLVNLFLFSFIVACNKNNNDKIKEEPQKEQKQIVRLSRVAVKDIRLETTTVAEGELTADIAASAKIVINQDLEAFVGSLVQGRVSKVFVNIGDYVKKGSTLMFIEGLQIGEIKAQFLKAKANLSYSESNYNRLKTLIEQNVGSQKSYLEAKAEYEKSKAEFNAEDKKIHSIGLTDKDLENGSNDEEHVAGSLAIKSPIEGTVAERNAAIGQLVEPNTNSFRIINTSSIFVDGQIYENDIKRISGKPEIVVTTSMYPEMKFKGKVIYISDIVDRETRTFKVRATVTNPDKKLKPEMFVDMHIPTQKSARAVLVPVEAVLRDANENYVFVAVNDTCFEKRDVVLGSSQQELVEIKKGIKIGERIVGKGVFMLKSELKKETLESGD